MCINNLEIFEMVFIQISWGYFPFYFFLRELFVHNSKQISKYKTLAGWPSWNSGLGLFIWSTDFSRTIGLAWILRALDWASLLEPISYNGVPYSALMQGLGTCSFPNLKWQTLLTSYGSSYLLEEVDREWAGEERQGAGGEMRERLWMECKMEFKE